MTNANAEYSKADVIWRILVPLVVMVTGVLLIVFNGYDRDHGINPDWWIGMAARNFNDALALKIIPGFALLFSGSTMLFAFRKPQKISV